MTLRRRGSQIFEVTGSIINVVSLAPVFRCATQNGNADYSAARLANQTPPCPRSLAVITKSDDFGTRVSGRTVRDELPQWMLT